MDLRSAPRSNGTQFWLVLAVLLIVGVVLLAIQVADMSLGEPGASEPTDSVGTVNPALVLPLAGLMIAGGIVGLVITVIFLVKFSHVLMSPPFPGVSPSILIRAFLVYLVSSLFLQAVAGVSMALSGVEPTGDFGSLFYLTLQSLAILTAFALGLGAFSAMTGYSEDCYRRIGLKLVRLKTALEWGIGGYLAAMPLFLIATALSRLLDNTIFRNIKTPEHPLAPYVTSAGAGPFAVVLILGVVIAPLVEETFFRGVLYGALRDVMRVWAAAAISAMVFALVHPLPTYLLPILVLGVVFAVVREKSGSLVPSMIAHGIHNCSAIILARLLH